MDGRWLGRSAGVDTDKLIVVGTLDMITGSILLDSPEMTTAVAEWIEAGSFEEVSGELLTLMGHDRAKFLSQVAAMTPDQVTAVRQLRDPRFDQWLRESGAD